MTQRKPPAVRWESWVEKQIREAKERGDFEGLPGAGRPLPEHGEPYDESWWIRDKAQRERISLLPATLVVRKKAEHLDEHLGELRSEADVRAAVEALNTEIVQANRTAFGGPPSRLLPQDVDVVVDRWRVLRAETVAAAERTAPEPARDQPRRRGLTRLLWGSAR